MSWRRTLAATAHITMHPAELVGKQRPMTDYRNHRTYTPTKTLKAEKAIKDASARHTARPSPTTTARL